MTYNDETSKFYLQIARIAVVASAIEYSLAELVVFLIDERNRKIGEMLVAGEPFDTLWHLAKKLI